MHKMVKYGKVGFFSGYLCAFFRIYAYMQGNFHETAYYLYDYFDYFSVNSLVFYGFIVKSTKNKNSNIIE